MLWILAYFGFMLVAATFFILEVGIGCGLIPKPERLQFSVRALMIVMTISAILFGLLAAITFR
jgi:hypothetical protein